MTEDSQIRSWPSMVQPLFPTCSPFLRNSSFIIRKVASLNSLWSTAMFQFHYNALSPPWCEALSERSGGHSLCPSRLTVWMWKKATLNKNTSRSQACVWAYCQGTHCSELKKMALGHGSQSHRIPEEAGQQLLPP